MATPPKATVISDLSSLVRALEKHHPETSLTESSKMYTGAEVIAEVRALLVSATAVREARGTLKDALVADRKLQRSKAFSQSGGGACLSAAPRTRVRAPAPPLSHRP
jgi:hypothetical protein